MDPLSLAASIIPGIISGGASLLGGQQSNAANAQQAMWNNVANQNFLQAQMNFNAAQSGVTRDWTAQQMQSAEAFNAGQAQNQMAFQDTEMGKAMSFDQSTMNQAMSFNAQQAQMQRDYETQMSNTAYQRAVSGMKAAGLNPILSAGTGGASTPTVGSASVSAPTVGIPGGASGSIGVPSGSTASAGLASGVSARMADVMSPAVSNAMQGAKLYNDLSAGAAGIAQTKAATNLTNQNIDVANSQADINNQTVSNLRATYDNLRSQQQLINNQASDAAASARLKGAQVDQTNRATQTMGGDVSGFGFRVNPFAWWPPSGTSFSPGNPGTNVPASPVSNSDSVWGETGGDGSSHSWTIRPDGSRGVQLW